MKMKPLLVFMSVLILLAPSLTSAQDASGCEGLSDFREELFPIGEMWAAGLNDLVKPERSPASFSSDDWLHYAETSLKVQRELKRLDPPDWLEDWLQVRIESTGLQEQVGKAAAESGFLIILGFESEFNSLDERDETTKKDAIERCPDFETFAYDWDALDGEVNGTPVAKPTSMSN